MDMYYDKFVKNTTYYEMFYMKLIILIMDYNAVKDYLEL